MQARVGVREKMAGVGARAIRDYMPEQHRAFFSQLPLLVVGTVDAAGQPWASVVANPPGFIASPHPRALIVRARPLAFSPLRETLIPGSPIAFLGIEPHTRRRNRMNGIIENAAETGFSARVQQSFGNCTKHIRPRRPEYMHGGGEGGNRAFRSAGLNAAGRKLIREADTFFIATAYHLGKHAGGSACGVDVSHRGGKPGFVHVGRDDTLTVPDFAGNFFFNTLGNLTVNPRAGLLFIDFETGSLLYLAVDAKILWDGAEVTMFDNAERLLRFRVREMRLVERSLPIRWTL